MQTWTVWVVLMAETLLAGGLMLLIPRVTRRGLLFGVYVGEAGWTSDDARRITRTWYRTMLGSLAGGLGLGTVLTFAGPDRPLGAIASLVVLLAGFAGGYLRAHFHARSLAVASAPVAAAALVVDTRRSLAIPIAATVLAAVGGAISVGYAWAHYGALPAMVPTHFGPSGTPDAWAPRSFRSVMLLPVMTAFIGPAIGLMACLTARAKRAIRQADGGVSLDAQLRFRRAVATFLSGIVVLTSAMLTTISVTSVRVALGLGAGLSTATFVLGLAIAPFAVGGALYLMLRYGQGGARFERDAAGSPLTGGVADNAHWVLGLFYVNREDPSIIVEKRFGVGYTINFGNVKAVLIIAGFFLVLVAVLALALSMPETRIPPAGR